MARGVSATGSARMPLLRAFVWLRWRVLANSLSRRRRSGWQRLGAVAEVAGKVLLWSMAGGGALLLAVAAGFLPWALTKAAAPDPSTHSPPPDAILLIVRILLGGFMLVLLIVPAFQGLARGSLGRTRLQLLPIRDEALHALEVGAHLGDPWLLMTVPALAAIAVGTVVVAAPGSAVVLLAGAFFVLALAALSATASFGVELALRNRRRAEALGLVVMLVWISAAMMPGFLQSRERARKEAEVAATVGDTTTESTRADGMTGAAPGEASETREELSAVAREERRRREEAFARFTRFTPVLQVLPSEAYTRALSLAVSGRPGAALAPVGVLALTTLALFALSRSLWRRLQASPASSGGRTGATELPRPPRLPGLSAAASAVAWGQLRGLLRSLVGRLNLVIGPVMVLFVALMVRSDLARFALGERTLGAAWTGVALAVGGAALALLSLQSFAFNQYAIDGAGFSLELLAPLPRRELVLGKWAAGAVLALALTVLTTGVVVSLEPAALPFWPAILLAAFGAYALLAPVASWVSMLLPKAVDLGRLGRAAQPNQLAVLLGTLVTPLTMLPAIVVGATAFAATGSVLALTAAEAVWAALALLLSRLLLAPVCATLARREEAIHLALLERG
jgi:hypothetical protein